MTNRNKHIAIVEDDDNIRELLAENLRRAGYQVSAYFTAEQFERKADAGYQMLLLACFVRIYAFTRGFLPAQHYLARAFKVFTLEKGLLAGGLAVAGGLAIIGATLYGWALGGFGELEPLVQTRWVIAGRTIASLGAQTILFSLVFSYLGLDEKPRTRDD